MLRPGRVRRILELSGYRPRLGLPPRGGRVGVWGATPAAARGRAIARWRGAQLLTVEDAFLRSVRPGRAGDPPLGLLLDGEGVHFDPARPSALERILTDHPLDELALIERAQAGMARISAGGLSKYNDHDPDLAPPAPGYVLVIDQTAGDASVTASGATGATFAAMLAAARAEHPDAEILVRVHPETRAGLRPGHFGPGIEDARVRLLTAPVAPGALLAGARAVYTVASQMGFEAILVGHAPRVFGQPFYAGWGLTQDERPPPRRGRRLTAAQLFAAAMILAPTWYDPCRDRLCSFEEALAQLEAEVRAWREDRAGHVAAGMRLWKRPHLQRFFGRWRPLVFADRAPAVRAARDGRGLLAWASAPGTPARAAEAAALGIRFARVEDGFLRSRGLGARLVPPMSLVADDLGIYYDPARESRLERLIAACGSLRPDETARAAALVAAIAAGGVSKYMAGAAAIPPLPEGRRILVPGQVEDDASILTACPAERTNLALLERVRAENPGAVIVYKPHPDVEAGLRPGAVPAAALARLADAVVTGADPAALIAACDEVWTLTSLLGFEALLRGRPVTCLGVPFYAGWGLTRDLAPVPARRTARPGLAALAHAALIAYPRYLDPVSGLPCPPEVVVARLATGRTGRRAASLRLLAKAQGLMAGQARLWRR
ncbi:MAG: capsular polysaccharide biosynthesis protein [Rhodobacteraceae bacterium]|nr:capsular polysaccharide biosynthesis protein [Paracoccaceae bacterium]